MTRREALEKIDRIDVRLCDARRRLDELQQTIASVEDRLAARGRIVEEITSRLASVSASRPR